MRNKRRYWNHIETGILAALMLLVLSLTGTDTLHAAQRLGVKTDIANVRSGPGTGYEVLWQVEKYHPLLVLKEQSGWVFFQDFEGDKAWIHQSLLGKIDCVISNKDKCNVRSSPTTSSDIVFTVEKGVPFKVIQKKGQWLKVTHSDGDTGWIYKPLVW